MNATLSDFNQDIDEAISNNLPLFVSNDSREHTSIVAEHFFRHARKEIIFLCHKMAKEIYGQSNVINALKAAYENNPKLQCVALVRDETPDSSDFLDLLLAQGAGIYSGIGYEQIDKLPDTLIVDRTSARIETDSKMRSADIFHIPENDQTSRNAETILKSYVRLRDLHSTIKHKRENKRPIQQA